MSKLFIFEGPDYVGKTTISTAVERELLEAGIPCARMSFPGHEPGSLGAMVRALHDELSSPNAGIRVAPAALQVLHVAAHIDAIERRILPLLEKGVTVLLDRFWWSTVVYAKAAGVSSRQIRRMLDVEALSWGDTKPAMAFLVEREHPAVNEQLAASYSSLASRDGDYPIRRLDNNRDISLVVDEAVQAITTCLAGVPPNPTSQAVPGVAPANHDVPLLFATLSPVKVSPVYDSYWRFAAERQEIFFRRFKGSIGPLTDDQILRHHKFTNVYRASDRVSQYFIKQVAYRGDQAPDEIFFRTLLFKLFNKIETWQLLERNLDAITWRNYDFDQYDEILSAALKRGDRIYSAAYIMPTARGFGDQSRKHRTHLQLLENMVRDGAPDRLANAKSLRQSFEILKRYPMMGDFLAFQFVIDLNYSTLLNFSESEFVVPGPGARDGIRKCFIDYGGLSEADLIRLVAERQELEFERLGLRFKSLWGRPMQLIDCQNVFCETDKYARLVHPEVIGISGRTKIKQLYKASAEPMDYWYPPKWNLNELISANQAARLAI